MGDALVTRRIMEARRGRGGVARPVEARRERDSSEEVTEVYSQPFRPVRAMNDVIDELLRRRA